MKKTSVDRLREIQIQCGYSPRDYSNLEEFADQSIPKEIPRLLRKKYLKAFLEEFRKVSQSLPTEYQDPQTYALLKNLFDSIHQAAVQMSKDNTFTFPEKLTYGTADIGTFTAFVADFDAEKDYLLLVSDGLFTFANLMAKSIGMLTIKQEGKLSKHYEFSLREEDIAYALRTNHEAILRFTDLILAYVLTNKPEQAQQYTPDMRLAAISSLLRESFELFIVGHEYSHLLLGHMDKPKSRASSSSDPKEREIDTALENWFQETNADVLGAYLAIIAMKGYDFASSYAGVDICLITLIILERLETELKGNSMDRMTHPPGEIRRDAVFRKLSETDPAIKGIYDSNTYIVDALWDRCMYIITDLDKSFREKFDIPLRKVHYPILRSILYRVGDVLLSRYDEAHP